MIKNIQINIYLLFTIINLVFSLCYTSNNPNILFVTITTTILISLNNILKEDYRNGILEQLIIYKKNLYFSVFRIITNHWLKNGLILSLISLMLMQLLGIEQEVIIKHFIALTYLSITITTIGTLGESASLNEMTNIKGTIVTFPLLIPSLIFAALISSEESMKIKSLAALAAISILSSIISVIISAINIKISVEHS